MTLPARRHLQREKVVGFNQTAVGHLHRRMVGPQFAEQHVERDGFGALRGKFFDEPAIDLTRPVKPETGIPAGRFARRQCWNPQWRQRRDWWRRARENAGRSARANRRSSAPAAQKNRAAASRTPQTQQENGHGQKDRRAFEGFELHPAGLNEKPEQLKAALVFAVRRTGEQNSRAVPVEP